MVSIGFNPGGQFSEERRNVVIGLVMIILAVLFVLYMGTSLVHNTLDFWSSCSIGQLLD